MTGGALSRQECQRPVAGGFELPVGHGEFDLLWLVSKLRKKFVLKRNEFRCGRRSERTALAVSGFARFPRRALALWSWPPPLSSESRYQLTRFVSVPALLLPASSPAFVIPPPSRFPRSFNYKPSQPLAPPSATQASRHRSHYIIPQQSLSHHPRRWRRYLVPALLHARQFAY